MSYFIKEMAFVFLPIICKQIQDSCSVYITAISFLCILLETRLLTFELFDMHKLNVL